MSSPAVTPVLRPRFAPGDPVPWFTVRSSSNPEYHFHTVAGRHVVLWFAGSMAIPAAAAWQAELQRHRAALFDDTRASLFVVSVDATDERQGRLGERLPGQRVFWDDGAQLSARFGLAGEPDPGTGTRRFSPAAVLLDPSLRVVRWFFPRSDGSGVQALIDAVAALPHPATGPAAVQAPVLVLPRVFEPEFCRHLIDLYEQRGGHDSGYMKSVGGKIEGVIDYSMKRRSDYVIEDEKLRREIADRFIARVNPEIARVFRFRVTRMERYLVACYDAEVGGYFRPHRDNDGDGHREFAVSLNLNAEEHEGGDLRFPEYGLQTYRPPTGGACVFSCGLMHEATPVTQGRRYVFLPFLYDEAAARRREEANARHVDPDKHYSYTPR